MRHKHLTVLHESLVAFEQKRNEQIRTENSQQSQLEKMKKVVYWGQMQQERLFNCTSESKGTGKEDIHHHTCTPR